MLFINDLAVARACEWPPAACGVWWDFKVAAAREAQTTQAPQ